MFKTFALAVIAAAAAATNSSSGMDQLFAQTELAAAAKTHTCLETANRNKAKLVDFNTLVKQTTPWTDTDFTADTNAVYWKDLDTLNAGQKKELGVAMTWKRATAMGSDKTLFGKGISPDDAVQGEVGNCWFIASASAVAEVPGRLEKIFLNKDNKLNAAGVYGVNLYTLGVPHTVIVDDYFAQAPLWGGPVQNRFANHGTDKSMWGAVLEKAYAKSVGNYFHTSGGSPAAGVKILTGAPYESHYHSQKTADQLWAELTTHDGKNDIINAGTAGGNHNIKNLNGLS